MNNRTALLFQAIRGPVLLMTVGVLFALQQTGYISVWRTWPVVLIVIGVMKLLERAARPSIPSTVQSNIPYGPTNPPAPNNPYGPNDPYGPNRPWGPNGGQPQ